MRIRTFVGVTELLKEFVEMDFIVTLDNGEEINIKKYKNILISQKGLMIELLKEFNEIKEEKDKNFLLDFLHKLILNNLFDISKIIKVIKELESRGCHAGDIQDLQFSMSERGKNIVHKATLVEFLTALNELSKEPNGLEIVRYNLCVERSIKAMKYLEFIDAISVLGIDKFFDFKNTESFNEEYLKESKRLSSIELKTVMSDFLED